MVTMGADHAFPLREFFSEGSVPYVPLPRNAKGEDAGDGAPPQM
jgi:hypothetical protein